ncbi:arginyl-tRNA synthetase [Caldicellulosiruptor saccharolyticus DSM 8903]|uniref:Arginine--tRNA ligase n=1 Tax=Caldicellulosiruptor saccharolyticus (strain ATCC 43494 / DSM 8903 / Tp8T 6331) TaxID=351627 RepID=A4XJ92_CALS8|nr:arginine--tRNA ligase [Caldicellulosiruptor saccharolyticus]ABP66977.1 arginyl-tRNA synthetase [Caldicellulosiruptor saccharolyticus DSM 8903]
MNLVKLAKDQIKDTIEKAINTCIEKGIFQLNYVVPPIMIEKPKEKAHGDFATNIAMELTRKLKKNPREIAQNIVDNIDLTNTLIEKVEVAGPGFINFFFKKEWLYKVVDVILSEGDGYGRVDIGNGKKVMVEFVSANPTGPMHMGNARGGALGDCLANLLKWAGYKVTKEFYVNDAGNQIEKFGQSLEIRYRQLKGENIELPEDCYHGDDIIERVKEYLNENGDDLEGLPSEERRRKLVEFALKRNIALMKEHLQKYGIEYDVWFHESSLYESGEVYETIEDLKRHGFTYEKDGAVWFAASKLDENLKDEVLIRTNGIPTYFAADIAYHRNKFEKRGFDIVIDIWGADHHGHVPRMKAAMKALGIDPERLVIILMQLVRLVRGKEIVRMSKRTGKAITLIDLIEEIGKDAARFMFNTKSADTHIEIDLDLVTQQTLDNPVFYVQYAHARTCGILRALSEEGIVLNRDKIKLELLQQEEELELLKKLLELPEEIEIAARNLDVSRVTKYLLDLASIFHAFYNACRVKNESEELMHTRLSLVECVRIVIKNVLTLLGVDAPEKM